MTSCTRARISRDVGWGTGQAGFTLVELMLVVGIATILVMLAVPNFMGLLRRSNLSGEGRQLFAAFNEAKGLAISEGTRHELFFDRGNRRWEIRSEVGGVFTRIVKTHPQSGSWSDQINFGPQNGVAAAFAAPYNSIAHNAWCTPCAAGNASCSIIFGTDGRIRDASGSLVSGSVLLHDPTGETGGAVEALVFVGATGNARLFKASE